MIAEYDNFCMVCGKPREHVHHLIFGRGLRELADQDELTAPLCSSCHNQIHESGIAGYLSKVIGQQAWETRYMLINPSDDIDKLRDRARLEFMARYGRSWI